MALFVHKYGGTSVGSIQQIRRIAETLAQMWRGGDQVVVVLSAMGDATDRLVALAREAAPSAKGAPSGRELDALLSSGEQVSAALLALVLRYEHDIDGLSFTGAQAGIRTDSAHNKARILDIDTTRLRGSLKNKRLPVVAGFQGVNDDGDITTLGRGGSDTSAVALAVALQAEACRIYTDVDGVYTTDPRIVSQARLIRSLTFEEMLEMAGLGAKVLQIRAVQFASKYNMPIHVLSSSSSLSDTSSGTVIRGDEETKEKLVSEISKQSDNPPMEKAHITGIAFNRDEAQLTLTGVPDTPGIAAQILGGVAAANIEVDMIVQNVGAHDGLADFTFTVHRGDYERAREILGQTVKEFGAQEVLGDNTVVKVSIVGVGMRSHAGVAATMFKALADNQINIRMISTSEIKVSVVIDEARMEDAVRVLHEAFELDAA